MTYEYNRRFWNRRKRRRRVQKKNFPNKYKDRYHTKRRQINMFDNMMGPNAKFYGHFLWKPVNSEESSPVCRKCEEKRSSCFAVSNIFFRVQYSSSIYSPIATLLHLYTSIYIIIFSTTRQLTEYVALCGMLSS